MLSLFRLSLCLFRTPTTAKMLEFPSQPAYRRPNVERRSSRACIDIVAVPQKGLWFVLRKNCRLDLKRAKLRSI